MSEEKKPPEIVFAPGCFDEFDGTQEELQEFIAMIHQMAEDGSLLSQATQLNPEEEEALWQMLEDKSKKEKQ